MMNHVFQHASRRLRRFFTQTWPVCMALSIVVATTAHAQLQVLSEQEIAQLKTNAQQALLADQPDALRKLYQSLHKPDANLKDALNAGRVMADLLEPIASNSHIAPHLMHYAVPPLSSLMRLHDAYPLDGQAMVPLSIHAAQDEYEPASFVLYAYANFAEVQLSVSDLVSPQGHVFPANQLDLKVVKVWYQNGNGWLSYFSDVGLALVPELLVKDENLIHVDTKRKSNHARIRLADGDERRVWISAPRELDVPFDHYQPGFSDATDLQPVVLEAGRFKQFFITAHVPASTPAGLYEGTIRIRVNGQEDYLIPLRVNVLPWRLPLPMAWFDAQKSFTVSLMGAWPRVETDHPAYMPTLLNLRRHNLYHTGPGFNPRSPEHAQPHVQAMKDAGFQTQPIFIRHSVPWLGTHDATPYTFDQLMAYRRVARAWREFFEKEFGHHDVHLGLGDEPTVTWVTKTRHVWRIFHDQGMKMMLAGHHHLFVKAGHMLDMYNAAGMPDQPKHALQHHIVGHGRISFYANQHNGTENPDFVRRQHGLLGYLAGMSAIYNYEFAYGPWNDLSQDLYKPMVLAYPTHTGLVDTLAWEGFREAVDDMRYATLLRKRAVAATQASDPDVIYAGRKVMLWFALLDPATCDLHAVRLEMIRMLLELDKFQPIQSQPE